MKMCKNQSMVLNTCKYMVCGKSGFWCDINICYIIYIM
jgi:hypothetical protein